jgi:hypothetical protein
MVNGTIQLLRELKKSETTNCSSYFLTVPYIPGGRNLEGKLHHDFAHLRVRPDGEWFFGAQDLLTFVELETNCPG